MERKHLEWLEDVQEHAYTLHKNNRMSEDDYLLLDNTIDQILNNNGVNTSEQDF